MEPYGTRTKERGACSCCLIVLVLAVVLMLAWNLALVPALGVQAISYYHAVLLIILVAVAGAAYDLFRR